MVATEKISTKNIFFYIKDILICFGEDLIFLRFSNVNVR